MLCVRVWPPLVVELEREVRPVRRNRREERRERGKERERII